MFLLLLLHGRRHQVQNQGPACRALMFVVRIFVDDTIAIAVWTSFDTITIALWISFHLCVPRAVARPCAYKDIS